MSFLHPSLIFLSFPSSFVHGLRYLVVSDGPHVASSALLIVFRGNGSRLTWRAGSAGRMQPTRGHELRLGRATTFLIAAIVCIGITLRAGTGRATPTLSHVIVMPSRRCAPPLRHLRARPSKKMRITDITHSEHAAFAAPRLYRGCVCGVSFLSAPSQRD